MFLPCNVKVMVFWALSLLVAGSLHAEELDLAKARTVDWSKEEHGKVLRALAVLAPLPGPLEVSRELRKGNGIRLSTEDREHTIVVALGILASGTRYTVTQATIDRFHKHIELTVIVEPPSRETVATPGKKDADVSEDFFIAPTQPAEPKVKLLQPLLPQAAQPIHGITEGNTAVFIPAGKLDPGKWWLRVVSKLKENGKFSELPPITDTFIVNDNRLYAKGEKGRNTPEPGLKKPNSPGVTDGLGGP